MDTSLNYIKMCEGALESIKWMPSFWDYFRHIPLFRQDEL